MRRIALLVATLALALATFGGYVALMRAMAPSVRAGTGGFNIPVVVGTPAHVGVRLDPDGDVRLRDVAIDLPPGLRGSASLSGRLPDGSVIGATTGGQIPDVVQPVEGELVPAGAEFQQVLLSFVSDVPGVYHVPGVTIASGSWLTGRRERIDTDICIVVVAEERELRGATDACD